MRIAEGTRLGSPAAKGAVDAAFVIIAESLVRGEDARILGFAVFGTGTRPARIRRNPRTGESAPMAASTTTTFKSSNALGAVAAHMELISRCNTPKQMLCRSSAAKMAHMNKQLFTRSPLDGCRPANKVRTEPEKDKYLAVSLGSGLEAAVYAPSVGTSPT